MSTLEKSRPNMVSRGMRPLAAVAVVIAGAAPAHAELVEVEWTARGSFERQLSIAPGNFAEACGKLPKGAAVDWRYEGSVPLNFNVHFHQGNDVVFPARADAQASSSGTLKVEVDQHYCWMWTNKAGETAVLRVVLQRR